MRIVLADDAWLVREGLARLLTEHGHAVAGVTGHPDDIHRLVRDWAPDAVILDIKMPPTFTDEGLRLAGALRRFRSDLPLLLPGQTAVARRSILPGSGRPELNEHGPPRTTSRT
jgi:DNA-binding NarL/FixJ family response regulator